MEAELRRLRKEKDDLSLDQREERKIFLGKRMKSLFVGEQNPGYYVKENKNNRVRNSCHKRPCILFGANYLGKKPVK